MSPKPIVSFTRDGHQFDTTPLVVVPVASIQPDPSRSLPFQPPRETGWIAYPPTAYFKKSVPDNS